MTRYGDIISLLVQHNVEFIIVGGVAATAHGSARFTRDLDIVYSRQARNIEALVAAIKPLKPRLRGAPDDLPFAWDEETVKKGLNFTLATTAGALDLLGGLAGGGTFEHLDPYSVRVEIFGYKCAVLGLERLIDVKQAAGRPKDFEAIAELEAILEERNR